MVIKPDGIGDHILFRNYLQFLRESDKFRDHKIYLLTNIAIKDLAVSMDTQYVDQFYYYADSYFLKWKLIRLLYQLQQLKTTTIIYPNYSRKYPVDWLVHQIRATNKIGIDGDTMNQPLPFKIKADKYYSELITLENKFPHEFDRNKQIFEAITSQKCSYIKPFIDGLNIVPHESIVVFPGGSENSKRWSPDNFSQLCEQITSKLKTPVILTGGKEEITIGKEITRNISLDRLSNKIGLLNLVELCSVIGGAKLLISNDSVAVHIAVALNIPIVCISKGDLYGRFIPYPKHIFSKMENITPASFHPKTDKYNQWSSASIDDIHVTDVFNAVQII